MEVKELGHIVLYVRDLERSRAFYRDVLGWNEIAGIPGQMAMYSSGRTHHELLLIEVGPDAVPIPRGRRAGMYHFGLKVGTTDEELRDALKTLLDAGATVSGSADHGVTHSLYIEDVQPERWREDPQAVLAPVRALQI